MPAALGLACASERVDPAPTAEGAVIAWLRLLAEEGYRPVVRRGTSLLGRTRVIVHDDGREPELILRRDVPDFFYLSQRVRLCGPALPPETLWRAAHDVGARLMCAKVEVSPAGGELLVSVETFLSDGGPSKSLLLRALQTLRGAVSVLVDELPPAATAVDWWRPEMNEPKQNTPERLAKLWMEHLAQEGFRPELLGPDEDGDYRIRFKHEGDSIYVDLLASDSTFVTLSLQYSLPEPVADPARLYRVAHDTSMHFKAAKTRVDVEDGSVRFGVELLLEEPTCFARGLERGVRLICAASDEFFAALEVE